jgi:8-hydroxy-5-deazaflavin:NADPH oxidoreductase
MTTSIIGTGKMARAIGTRLLAGGNEFTLVGTSLDKAQALAEELGGGARAEEAPSGDVVILAVYYGPAMEAIPQYADSIAGKVLVDITNPVTDDYSALLDTPAGSAAEEIAAAAPDGTRVVKAFNTIFAGTLAEGEVAGQPLDVFMAGDDDDAKSAVAALVEAGGLRAVDAGPLSQAGLLEAAGFLHMSVQGPLGTGYASALKIVA